MASEGQFRHWVDRVREYREQVLYPKLFGASGEAYSLAREHFARFPGGGGVDPPDHWLAHRVLAFPPSADRGNWLYATSGLSNDWLEDSPAVPVSGLGCELVLQCTEHSPAAAEQLLHLLATQLTRFHRRKAGEHPLGDFDRVPVCGSAPMGGTPLRWLMLAPPGEAPFEASLPSGRFDFHQVIAISEAEAGYARSHGGAALLLRLEQAGAYPVIDWQRAEVV